MIREYMVSPEPTNRLLPSFAGIRRKPGILSIAFGLGRWDRIVRGVRPSSSRRAPFAAANAWAVAGSGNAGAHPARESFEQAAGTELAADHLRA